MGKRSNFPRYANEAYDTPAEAVVPLLPHLQPGTYFIDPCAGAGELIKHLSAAGHICVDAFDIEPRAAGLRALDFLAATGSEIDNEAGVVFITNPPWKRDLLHAFIERCREYYCPAWLLIDANWMFTQQAAPYLTHCERIVTVGRVIWIPGTKMTGKDDCAWFLFQPVPVLHTRFIGRKGKNGQT